jgi:hypothetical protein
MERATREAQTTKRQSSVENLLTTRFGNLDALDNAYHHCRIRRYGDKSELKQMA